MKSKAGLIPYIIEDATLKVILMIPSNPKFGGTEPQIAKGGIESYEQPIEAAIREAKEELGFVYDENKHIILNLLYDKDNEFHIFAIKLNKEDYNLDFVVPGFEAKERIILTYTEALNLIKPNQKKYLEALMYNIK